MADNPLRERTVLFIDGSNFYAAARALNMDIDYARMRAHFAKDANLIRACYYTALPEDQEYSPLRPLIDWLDYTKTLFSIAKSGKLLDTEIVSQKGIESLAHIVCYE